MLLHDVVTVVLFFSYLAGNLVNIGTMIAALHDLTDIPFHISKALHTSIYEKEAVWPFIFGQLLWAWCRLLCFPVIIYSVYYTEYIPSLIQYQSQMTVNAIFLGSLYFLHWLWFMMFQRLNYKVLCGVTADPKPASPHEP